MRLAICGSIATDHLMTYQGRFAESLVPDQLDKISLSFLVDDLQVRRGGIGANISFGMAVLGHRPLLIGAVGEDFAVYRSWLERHGVVCDHVLVSDVRHTARFVVTTDRDMAQIASFYSGAMAEARAIELGPISEAVGGLDLVMVSPDDPEAMLRHSAECRSRGIPFAADPSQQLAFMDGAAVRKLVDGATYLFTNDYEASLTERKTGWSAEEIMRRVHTRVITRGKHGASVLSRGAKPIHVPIAAAVAPVDPTGVGDGFRAGFLAGLAWGLGHERCAQLGSTLASYVLQTVGTQEYSFEPAQFLARFEQAYGAAAAIEVGPHLGSADDDHMPQEPPPTPWQLSLAGARPGEDLVAVGADLEPGTVLAAYRRGLFPMGLGANGAGPLGWWSPDPRGVLLPGDLHVSRSLRRSMRHLEIRVDTAFEQVIQGCADPARDGRWITPAITAAYTRLHRLGWAHSVEAWQDDRLAGGLYGLSLGGLFAAESMFHRVRDASKAAVCGLVAIMGDGDPGRWVVDVQWRTDHLATLGVQEVTRTAYLGLLEDALSAAPPAAFDGATAPPSSPRDQHRSG